MNVSKLNNEWFGNIKGDILAGIVVALALIPEAISFSIIAGVDPMVGLYASFCIAITIAFVGGRPAMISAATGATALVMVTLVAQHGLQYLLAATILTGIIQIIMGVLKLGNLIKFVPRSVMTGFVNALAIMIFIAQLPHFVDESWQMYAMVAGALAIIYILPRFTKASTIFFSCHYCDYDYCCYDRQWSTNCWRYGGVNPNFTILSNSRYSI